MLLSGVVAVKGSEIKRDFSGEFKMQPSAQPGDRNDGDEFELVKIPPDQAGWLNELNTSEMQILRLKASVECYVADIRRALEEPEGKRVLKFHGTEAATLGAYLRDAKDAEDLKNRSSLVWRIFDDALLSDSKVGEIAPGPINYFAESIIQHLAVSLGTIKCNEGLERVQLDSGMKLGEFLTKVHNQGVMLEDIPGDANTPSDQRELKSATIREGLKSSGEEIIAILSTEYQKYGSNFIDLLDDALKEDILNKYLPPFINLSDKAFVNLREFCIQECGSLYERHLNKSLRGRADQVFEALRSVGAFK
jgi:hypothetical protein